MTVYFARSKKTGLVKIGFTGVCVWGRMAKLKHASNSDIELLGVTPGSRKTEKFYHHKFCSRHRGGEWFSPANEILLEASQFACNIPPRPPVKPGPLKMKEHAELIEKLGGAPLVARVLELKQNAVSNWCLRGIPWRKRSAVARLAITKGVAVKADFLEAEAS